MKQAAVMLIIKDELILGISRKDNPTKFGLIGGKIEEDELPINAAIREVFEETGIKIIDCDFLIERNVEGSDFVCRCYVATKWEGEPTSKEGLAVQWLTEDEMINTKAAFPEYNAKTLTAYKARQTLIETLIQERTIAMEVVKSKEVK